LLFCCLCGRPLNRLRQQDTRADRMRHMVSVTVMTIYGYVCICVYI
jgi:hypothetical protein